MRTSLIKVAILMTGGGALLMLAASWVQSGMWQALCLAAGLVMLAAWAKTEHWFDAALTLFFLGAFVFYSFLPVIGPL